MDKRVQRIGFTTDKHGKTLAYRWMAPSMMRWLRVGVDDAKVRIATGAAIEVAYCPMACPRTDAHTH